MRLDVAFVDPASATTTLLLLLSTLVSFQWALTTDEPQFLVQPQSIVVAPQGEVTLRCEPRDSSTQILWVFNGEFILSSARDGLEITHGRLHIRSFRHRRSDGRNQAGVYQCIARNSVGAVISREAIVQQAYFGKFESDLKDLYVKSTEGNVAVIPCHPPTGNPPTLTAFEVNGSRIDLKSGRYYVLPSGNLQISPVRPLDQGQYRCLAINSVSGQQQRAPNTVHLKVVGESFSSFTCYLAGVQVFRTVTECLRGFVGGGKFKKVVIMTPRVVVVC
ncbi:hypothetical protein NP493_855g01006 [Ridgeia piscesae]|uniref:Ig-like domain-containing protein n=1 Tax=Ridgeia piscesae TaxID=27915 RepID=A0AAD9KLB8_RIDPI|nr:hypothetical protein NP493_855g01006 [Ridgeia piscesae]